ncbi:MAG: chemotaxis response regulator protein-glutamate methylesterase [Oscillospiraceae bacterium]|jgi:two-component system chemotaxis response regulator CheB|nr:chemotaxis response regulator protein-glutamate methylesterase [Oscillospiraceae bacterium]
MSGKKIRLMIVDDSVFFREFLSRSLGVNPAIEVVGVAADAFEAEKRLEELKPDVITLDMEMPKMRGADFLRKILQKYPRSKVVVISAIPNNVFEALHAGAVDFVSKPNTRPGFDNAAFLKEVDEKIKIANNSTHIPTAPQPAAAPQQPGKSGVRTVTLTNLPPVLPSALKVTSKNIIAIGASTGGTEAILTVVRNLPENTPGIVVVQHMPPVFTNMYAERLNKICKMEVREARDGDRVEQGLILIAPGDCQMRLRSDFKGYYVHCGGTEKVSGHCPSVDALFESVSTIAGANAMGVILTGMGADGAKGLLAMKKAGAHTFGQNQETCVVYGMPMVAFNIGAVSEQLPLTAIADTMLRRLTK